MLFYTCPSTSSHTRSQLREHDDAFVAVERSDSNGWCQIRRGSQEKIMYSFPSTVGDMDVKGLRDSPWDFKFNCPVWREGDCGAGAGEGEGGGAAVRARV